MQKSMKIKKKKERIKINKKSATTNHKSNLGLHDSPCGKQSQGQILTIEELLDGFQIDMPPIRQVNQTYRRAPRHERGERSQPSLLDKDSLKKSNKLFQINLLLKLGKTIILKYM